MSQPRLTDASLLLVSAQEIQCLRDAIDALNDKRLIEYQQHMMLANEWRVIRWRGF